MTILALILAVGPWIDIHAELNLPIPICVPELVGVNGSRPLTYPEDHPLVFHFADEPVRLFVQSSCRADRWLCVTWRVQCDSDCVWAAGGRTVGKNETRVDDSMLFTAPLRCWSRVEQVVCRVEYHPSALGDMDGNCESDFADVQLLAVSRAWNRLRIFAYLQNEWGGP